MYVYMSHMALGCVSHSKQKPQVHVYPQRAHNALLVCSVLLLTQCSCVKVMRGIGSCVVHAAPAGVLLRIHFERAVLVQRIEFLQLALRTEHAARLQRIEFRMEARRVWRARMAGTARTASARTMSARRAQTCWRVRACRIWNR